MRDKDPVNVKVGQNIKRIRKAKSLTQGELASKLGIKLSTLSSYETGARGLPISLIARLADTLSVPINFIVLGIPSGIQDEDLSSLDAKRLSEIARSRASDLAQDNLIIGLLARLLVDPLERVTDGDEKKYGILLKNIWDLADLNESANFTEEQLDFAYSLLVNLSLTFANLYTDVQLNFSTSKKFNDFTGKLDKFINENGYTGESQF